VHRAFVGYQSTPFQAIKNVLFCTWYKPALIGVFNSKYEIAALLARQRAGETVRLTLCGERATTTFETSRQGFFAKIAGSLVSTPLLTVLEPL
jgi:hypothetical protein